MKKIIGGLLVAIFLIPNVSLADNGEAGIEYLTPLVQTIITLLQERIADLSAENDLLRAQLANQPAVQQCPVLGSAEPAFVDPVKQRRDAIHAEYAPLIAEIETEIVDWRNKLNQAKTAKQALGSGITSYEIELYNKQIDEANRMIADLELQRHGLEVERNNKLNSAI